MSLPGLEGSPFGFWLPWACSRQGTGTPSLGTLHWCLMLTQGRRQQGLRREVWRAEARCHSWYGSLSRSRAPSGFAGQLIRPGVSFVYASAA